ncbi:hypothetical protein ABZ260_00710 [Streptosporangium sp. NPDC006013]|uniref:hypothetical protein n=1 Tax=Streptosporangium sp. NPDC006013 TaxID=3155596 RepID=UPI0033A02E22
MLSLVAASVVVAAPAHAAIETCAVNANYQQYYYPRAGNHGTTQVSRGIDKLRVAIKSAQIRPAGGSGYDTLGWALLVGDTRAVKSTDRVKIQISENGGNSVGRDCGWSGPQGSPTKFAVSRMWITRADAKFVFRACHGSTINNLTAVTCTAWW